MPVASIYACGRDSERKMVEENKKWVLPENLRKQEARDRAKVDAGDLNVGHCGAYYAYRAGIDKTLIETHAITDDAYALEYARNIVALLESMGADFGGNVLDAGCGIGFVTNALAKVNSGGRTFGLDLSEDAIIAAADRYADCAFSAQSADELDNFEDGFFDTIHSREFYPFTRVDDGDLHARFLQAFAAKLKPGGAVLLQMITEPHGLCNTFGGLEDRLRGFGFDRIERKVVVPLRLFRKVGALAYAAPFYGGILLAGMVLERIKPGRVGYLYFLRKSPGA